MATIECHDSSCDVQLQYKQTVNFLHPQYNNRMKDSLSIDNVSKS